MRQEIHFLTASGSPASSSGRFRGVTPAFSWAPMPSFMLTSGYCRSDTTAPVSGSSRYSTRAQAAI